MNNDTIKKYVRPNVLAMEGYVPGEQPRDGEYIKLNTNENPYPISPKVREAVSAEVDKLRLYPDPVCTDLRQAAQEVYGLPPSQVFVGNGSDEVLALLVRLTAAEGQKVASFYPSYVLYETLAQIQGAEFSFFAFNDDYTLPEKLPLGDTRLLFLPNPNSPSGTMVSHDEIRRLCKACAGIVVIDEAYADFADSTALPLLKECPNMVVTRTFSKSYSLAGGRVGLAFASEEIVAQLFKIKDSYNLDRLTQAAAAAALRDQAHMKANAAKVKITRARLAAALEKMGAYIFPSQANFVLARFGEPKAKQLYEGLKQKKILVRFLDFPRVRDCLRISVGTEAEIDSLLVALKSLL